MTDRVSSQSKPENGPALKWNIRLGRFLGIDVYLHFTFLLLLAFFAIGYWLPTRSIPAAIYGVAFFLSVFGCVLLHEFGHALAARRFGVGTRDITLLPIGGVARLDRMPDKPEQELWIALAGPAVNVGIATVLLLVLVVSGNLPDLAAMAAGNASFAERLLVINIFLVVFNLLPAFPMDGGRVLRALLALKLEYVRATHIAARLGQAMALLFAFAGLFGNPMLLFIALFVWMGASAEMSAAQARTALSGLAVSHAMVTEFAVLSPGHSLGSTVRQVLAGAQQDFPVMEGDRIVGLLERRHLIDGLARLGPEALVQEVMIRDFPVLSPHEMIESAMAREDLREFPMLPVVTEGRLLGLFTTDNLSELLLIQRALRRARDQNRPADPNVPPLIDTYNFRRI
jgi:Zn-dependent protease/predicted transcriptional regulator